MPDVLDNPQKQSIDEFLGENPKIDDFLGPESKSADIPSSVKFETPEQIQAGQTASTAMRTGVFPSGMQFETQEQARARDAANPVTQALNKPIIPVTPKILESVVPSPVPGLWPALSAAIPAVKGLETSAAKQLAGFTSVAGLATLPLMEFKVGRTILTGLMAAQTPEAVKNTVDVLKDKNATPAQKWESLGDAGGNLLMLGAGALSLLPAKVKTTFTPEQVAQVVEKPPVIAKKPTTTEVSSATQKGQVKSNIPTERPRDDRGGPPTEPVTGGGVPPATEQRAPQPEETGATGAPPEPVRNALTSSGIRFDKETPKAGGGKLWQFTIQDNGPAHNAAITVPAGSTEAVIRAKIAAKVKEYTAPEPDWEVSVQSAQGDVPGFVQIVDPRATEQSKSPTVESLRGYGHTVPDFSKLPQGKYTWAEAVKKANEIAKKEVKPVETKKEEKATKVLGRRGSPVSTWFPRSDGVPDILDAINELGGIASPSQSAFKGGEYDAYKEAFGSGMAMRLRRATGGHAPDRLMKQLEDYGFKFETADQFYDAVKQANESRKNLPGQAAAEEAQLRQEQEQHEDFRKSVVQGKGTTAPAKTAGDILAVGSTFTHGGETFTVKEYDPDSDTYLVEDGRRFGRQYLSADDPIHPDPGSLTGEQTTEFTPKESLKLEAPESVDEQNQRLAAEKKARDEKAAAEAAAADARAKAAGRTGGNLGSAGQGGLFEQTGQGEIFQPPPPKPPDVGPGMGAATPAEFGPQGQTATGFKNATVDRERAARGLPPAIAPLRRSFGEVWDRAMALIDQDPEVQDNLIEELRNKPRALTDMEDALLLHRQVDLQNEYAKETRAMAQAFDDGRLDAVEEGKARLARWSDQLLDIYDIGKTAGTETARGLNARKMMVNEDFSLAQMELSKRAANKGRPLTEAETAEIQRLHDKIAETQKAYDDYVARTQEKIAALEAANALNQAKTDVSASRQQTGTRSPKDINQRAEETTAKIVEKLKSGNKDEVTGLVQKLARIFVERGITDREKLIDAIHDVLKGGLPDITRRETMDAISGYGDFKPLRQDQVSATLRDLKGQMQQIGKLLDFFQGKAPKKTGPERRVPSDIERGLLKVVNEAKKRFGLTATDPARQLKSSLDAIKTRLRNQISDLESQINSRQKTVNERAPAPEDAESKALLEQRDKLKTEFDEIFGKPELTDAQRVKGALASLERQSTELERQIKEGDIFASKRESRTPSTPELEAAKARRDALKSEREYLRESIQPKERRTPEERALLALKTRLTNRTAELKAKLAAGDFASKPRRQVAFDSEAMRLKAENERVKQEYQRGLLLDELKHRTPFEKMQDTLVKWRRAFLLSGPVTLAKLTSAAIQRVTITPIEEAIGAGISRAFPELAKRAPREGGLAVSAEAKALTDGFTKGMKDAWDVLKTGKSELDVLYGKPNALPREAIDFFGNLHGALKTVTKRNEFSRSLAKRMQNAIANGVDATDPLVQTRLAQEAYRDANRSIFMQDNRVVSAYRRAVGALEQKSKITGKTPIAGKIAGTTARILLPIVKIPTNIVAETMQYATGSVTGSVRLANAFRKGIENLPPEHADLIMRDLKKGSLGAAVMLLGFLSPGVVGGYYQPGERRKKGDVKPGNARILGKDIPSYLLHNPLLETLQIGATIRRVADSKLHRRDTGTQGIGAGVMAGALGLSEEVPFVREQLETAKAFNPQQRGAFFGELTKSMGVPQAVQWAAREWDTDSEGNPISRQPNGVWEHIETGVPGLRQKVKRGPSQP